MAAEVRFVLKTGRSARQGRVSMRYIPAKHAKAAVIVSTKIARKAVDRNRLRRKAFGALSAPPGGTHLVVIINDKEFDPADIKALCSKLF
ncbi:hypothetical protein A2852_01590 [Candidatus Adlerbacteria bacterium RIFCSPHIGHO2_01_FULL_54_23]|nr:MAG: hypothetical protein UY83_C0008G0011 [Candidatus Adlerbacteria bacterium GW2011_GWA1_54_10]KKW36259.1 MAG: hypothetical protein UY84_C0001G0147 [Candidatus Adlerbacteria bacterium GW2011_GWA2_54_12]KKW37789.1 MAG: hypothetical protein UY86_C0003G0011 [Candidatus Adlerbacteria bacterium GW2011_GWB1_54_7]OGC78820.1 MAG: hypothetical protein A2852_01590 [Candidatus Adlerbacteria bacterium RIFCSPHIGHO2_01_FULL_54_23]